jgi:hypothetical protein
MIKKKTFKFRNEYDKTDKILIVFEDPHIYLYTKDGNYTLKFKRINSYSVDHDIMYETEDSRVRIYMAYTTKNDTIKLNSYKSSIAFTVFTPDKYYSWDSKRYILSNYEQRYKFNIFLFNKAKELGG